MNRTTVRLVRVAALAAAVAALASGCFLGDLLGLNRVTIEQRIADLQTELNKADRSQTYLLFHATATDYNAIKAAEFWEPWFPVRASGDSAYVATITSSSPENTPQDVRVTIGGGPAAYGGPFDYRLDMAQDSDDNWMIRGMDKWNVADGAWEPVVE